MDFNWGDEIEIYKVAVKEWNHPPLDSLRVGKKSYFSIKVNKSLYMKRSFNSPSINTEHSEV